MGRSITALVSPPKEARGGRCIELVEVPPPTSRTKDCLTKLIDAHHRLNRSQVAVGRKHIDAIVSLLLNKKNEPGIIFNCI